MTSTGITSSWTSSIGCPNSARPPLTCARTWPTAGWRRAPTRAKRARTAPISPSGSGRADGCGMRVLTVNTGSSSVKLRLVDSDDSLAGSVDLDAPEGRVHDDELAHALDGLGHAEAVGHRFVHGGDRFRSSVRLDETVLTQLLAYVDLAPLHQHAAIDAAKLVSRLRPTVPAVGCFDTAFHTTQVVWNAESKQPTTGTVG